MTPNELGKAFLEDGFVVVPNLFTRAESAAIKAECRKIVEDVSAEIRASGGDPKVALRTGVLVGLAARSAFFKDAVKDPRLLDVLEAVQGPNIEFLSDKVVYKNDATDFGSPWHQDWPYWRGSHKISVWVALDDVSPANGCLKVLPRSHAEFVAHDGDASDGFGFGHRLAPGAVDESRAVIAQLEAGGAVFFHDLTLHSSYPNHAHADRWVWIPTYRDAQANDPDYPWAVAAAVVRGSK
jgi:hypothetical protein